MEYHTRDNYYLCPHCKKVWAQNEEDARNDVGRFIGWEGWQLPIDRDLIKDRHCGCADPDAKEERI